MQNPQGFDYNQSSVDTLAGIYMEVGDSPIENPVAELNGVQGRTVVPAEAERLFGFTVTVGDENTSTQPSRTPEAG
jgi:hypothetical protein